MRGSMVALRTRVSVFLVRLGGRAVCIVEGRIEGRMARRWVFNCASSIAGSAEGRIAQTLVSSLVSSRASSALSSCSRKASMDERKDSRKSVMAEGRGDEESKMGFGLAEAPLLDKSAACRLLGGDVRLF